MYTITDLANLSNLSRQGVYNRLRKLNLQPDTHIEVSGHLVDAYSDKVLELIRQPVRIGRPRVSVQPKSE